MKGFFLFVCFVFGGWPAGWDGPTAPPGELRWSLSIRLLVGFLFFRAFRSDSKCQPWKTFTQKQSNSRPSVETRRFLSTRLARKLAEPKANSVIAAGKMQMCSGSIWPGGEQAWILTGVPASPSRPLSTAARCPRAAGGRYRPVLGRFCSARLEMLSAFLCRLRAMEYASYSLQRL